MSHVTGGTVPPNLFLCAMLYRLKWLAAALLCIAFTLTAEASNMSPEMVEGATKVDTQQAFDLFKQGALFVDLRDDPAWEAGRIPGAVHLELKKVF